MRKRSSQPPPSPRSLTTRRRRNLALEALENRMVLTQLSIGLFDTGVDAAGVVLPGGSADQHYTLPITQQGTPGMNAVVASPLAGGWDPNGPNSAWIAPTANQGATSTSPTGTYRYRTTFNVSDPGGGGRLTGSLGGDDNIVDVLINGVSTGYSRTGAFTFSPISLTGNLVEGVNTLDFVVANTGTGASPTGFHAKDLALNVLPSLTVDSSTVQYTSGASVVNGGSFGDPDPGDTVTITSNVGTVSQNGSQSGTYSYFESNVTSNHTVTITATDSRGGVKTVSFNVTDQSNVPPSLTAGGGAPAVAASGGSGVVVDPNIVVDDPDGPNLTTASVSIGSNFTAAEDRLLFTNQNGITGSYNTSSGILTLSGSATASQYQAALRSVRYQNINAGTPNQAARAISFSIAPGTFNPTTGHFYEFINSPGIAWTTARSAALGRDIFGLKGYLTTLTSAAENSFAFSKVQSVGWIGASDAAVEGDWRWMDGPEAGQLFYQGLGTGGGAAVAGRYNNWGSGEPNNAGNEDYAHYLSNGQWNDYANTTFVQGYVVEYGGSAGDPTLSLTSSATVNVVNRTATPTVTTPSASTFVNTASAPIGGMAASGSLVQVYFDVNGNGVIDPGDNVVASLQLAVGETSYSISTPLAQDRPNDFLVTATAAPSGESRVAVVPTITQDSMAPSFPELISPSAPATVNADDIAITGASESGSLVQVYVDTNQNGLVDSGDTLVGSQQLGAGASDYNITVPLTQDSDNHFLVNATDAAGNVSVATVVPVITEDSTAPAVPVVTSPSGPIALNTSTATIAGNAEAGSLVQIVDDANGNGVLDGGEPVVGAQQLAAGETSYSVDVPLASDAVNRFLVTSTDAVNNQSAAAVVPTITQDSMAPAPPTVTSPSEPITINAASATITGTAEAGSLVQVFLDNNNNGAIDGGENVVGSVQLAPGQTDYNVIVPLDQNATNDFVVTATDAGGNSSSPVDVPTITADSIAPALPIVTSPSAPATVNADNVAIAGTAEAGSFVEVFVDSNQNGLIDVGDVVVGFQQLGTNETDFSIVTPLTADSENHFLVTASDEAGNRSGPAVVPVVTEDSTAPASPVVTSPAGPVAVNTPIATIAGNAEAGSLVQVFDDVNGNGMLDNGEPVVGAQQLATGETSYSIDVPLASDAANRFLVTSTDTAGNPSPTAVVPTITQDSVPPALPTVTGPAGPIRVNAASATITGTADAGSLVRVFRDANNNGSIDVGDVVVGSVQLASGQSNYSVSVPLAQNAANNFVVAASDAAGNSSSPVDVPTITTDSIAPAAPIVTNPAGSVSVRTPSVAVSGTAEANSLVQVYRDVNNNGNIDVEDLVVASQQLSGGATSFTISTTLLPNSVNNFLVTATDATGNRSLAVDVPTVVQDSRSPANPNIGIPAAPTTVNGTTTTLNGTAEAGSLVQVFADTNGDGLIGDGDLVVGSVQLAPGQTSYSVTVPLVPDALNRFLIAATDSAGNRSSPIVVPAITQDSVTPTTPTIPDVSSTPTTVNGTTTTLTGTAEAGSLVQVFADTNGDGLIGDGDLVVGSVQLAPGQTSYSVTVPLVPDALNRFLIAATDSAGNRSSPIVVPTITQDSTAPAVPVVTGSASVNANVATLSGTAEPGSLVQVFDDANGNGVLDEGEAIVGSLQLAPGESSFSIEVPLALGISNRFLISAVDAAGNRSAPVAAPIINANEPIRGVVYLDVNANNARDEGEEGLAGRAVFVDQNGNGTLDSGEPITFTGPDGSFAFPEGSPGSSMVVEATELDSSRRYVVAQSQTLPDGSTMVGVVPFSPVAPVHVVPDPFDGEPTTDSDTAYIQSLYRAVLGRSGGDQEVQAWRDRMGQGLDREGVARGFVNSIEHRRQQVERFYQAFLGRSTDPLAENWVNALLAGASEEEVAEAILNSAEYRSSHQDMDALVHDLYLDVLGREGEASGVSEYASAVASGVGHAAIVSQFVRSAEATDQILDGFYSSYLRRGRDPRSGSWADRLNSPDGSASSVAIGILASDEFFRGAGRVS